jgi:hypothetical protein
MTRLRGIYEEATQGMRVLRNELEFTNWAVNTGSDISTYYSFHLDPILPVSVRYSSAYEMAHRVYEHEHKLDHAPESCPERLNPPRVRMWTSAGGWREIKLKRPD